MANLNYEYVRSNCAKLLPCSAFFYNISLCQVFAKCYIFAGATHFKSNNRAIVASKPIGISNQLIIILAIGTITENGTSTSKHLSPRLAVSWVTSALHFTNASPNRFISRDETSVTNRLTSRCWAHYAFRLPPSPSSNLQVTKEQKWMGAVRYDDGQTKSAFIN